MRCVEFERRLHELFDDRADGSACLSALPDPLERHAAKCGDCRGLLSAYRGLFLGLSTAAPVSGQVVNRVLAEVVPSPARKSYKQWVTPLTTAASVVVAISLAIATRNQQPKPGSDIGDHTVATQQSIVPVPIAQFFEHSPKSPANDVVSVSRPRSDFDEAPVGTVLNLAGFRPVTFSAEVLEAQLARRPEWIDGLKPVTDSLTSTLNALRRVLPGRANNTNEHDDQGARYERQNPYDHVV